MTTGRAKPIKWQIVEQAALEVLAETGNEGVCWGDAGLLHMIANRAGMKTTQPKFYGISLMWRRVLNALEKSPRFEKHLFTLPDRSFRVRSFWLKP